MKNSHVGPDPLLLLGLSAPGTRDPKRRGDRHNQNERKKKRIKSTAEVLSPQNKKSCHHTENICTCEWGAAGDGVGILKKKGSLPVQHVRSPNLRKLGLARSAGVEPSLDPVLNTRPRLDRLKASLKEFETLPPRLGPSAHAVNLL